MTLKIDLHGYGVFHILEENFKRFKEITGITDNLLLDIINFPALPILSINSDTVTSEGPIPYSHIPTIIGQERFRLLVEEGIIKKSS